MVIILEVEILEDLVVELVKQEVLDQETHPLQLPLKEMMVV